MVLFSGLWRFDFDQSRPLASSAEQEPLCCREDTRNAGSYSANDSENDAHDVDLEAPSLAASFRSNVCSFHVISLCLIYVSSYLVVAVVAFSYVFERWTIIDSVYFAVATFTTCGYGDVEPSTEAGQLFTILFAIYGVIILGVFIGIIGHAISQAQAVTLDRLGKKRQEHVVATLFTDPNHEQKRRKITFIHDHISLLDDIRGVIRAELPAIILVSVLALILGEREGWSLTSTAYFCIMSATTTGFGDYTPQTQADKIYCVFFLPLAVAVFGEVLGRIAGVYMRRKERIAEESFLSRTLTQWDLTAMDANSDGMVDAEEFMAFMLVALRKVDRGSIEELRCLFRRLDKNGNGVLDKGDLVALVRPNVERQKLQFLNIDDESPDSGNN